MARAWIEYMPSGAYLEITSDVPLEDRKEIS